MLLLIDPRDCQVKPDQAKSQLVVQQANLDQARANIRVAQADLVQAQKDYGRLTSLDPRAVSRQQVDSATATYRAAQAKLEAARPAAEAADAQLQLGPSVDAAQTQMQQADANVAAVGLQLSYCTMVAPVQRERVSDPCTFTEPASSLRSSQ